MAVQILNCMPFLFLSGFLFMFQIQFVHFHCDILDLVHFQLLLLFQREATVGNQQDLALKVSQLKKKYYSIV